MWVCTVCPDLSVQNFQIITVNECVCHVHVKHHFQQAFSHITMMSGCDRELNVHFCSAASLQYQVPDTLLDTTPSHIILTLGQPVR